MSDHWNALARLLGTPGSAKPPEPAETETREAERVEPVKAAEPVQDWRHEASAEAQVPEAENRESEDAAIEEVEVEGGEDVEVELSPLEQMQAEAERPAELLPGFELASPAEVEEAQEAVEAESSRWNELVQQLGVEPVAEPERPEVVQEPSKAAAERPFRGKRRKKTETRKPRPKSSFGAGLGVEVPDEVEEEDISAAEAVIDEVDSDFGAADVVEKISWGDELAPAEEPTGGRSEAEVEEEGDESEGRRPRRRRRRGRGRSREERAEGPETAKRAAKPKPRREEPDPLGFRSFRELEVEESETAELEEEDVVESTEAEQVFDDDHEDDAEVLKMRRGRRRKWRQRDEGPGEATEGEAEVTESKRPRRRRERPERPERPERRERVERVERPERVEREAAAEAEDAGDEEAQPAVKHHKVPTWEETVMLLVDSNLKSRGKDAPRRGGGRGRPRRDRNS